VRDFWRGHSLLIILAVIGMGWLIAGTWASWVEFHTNETAGFDNHAPFFSIRFFSFWFMQLAMNYVPELMGTTTIVLLHAKFRDRFEEKKS
jgi:hypothetical protein